METADRTAANAWIDADGFDGGHRRRDGLVKTRHAPSTFALYAARVRTLNLVLKDNASGDGEPTIVKNARHRPGDDAVDPLREQAPDVIVIVPRVRLRFAPLSPPARARLPCEGIGQASRRCRDAAAYDESSICRNPAPAARHARSASKARTQRARVARPRPGKCTCPRTLAGQPHRPPRGAGHSRRRSCRGARPARGTAPDDLAACWAPFRSGVRQRWSERAAEALRKGGRHEVVVRKLFRKYPASASAARQPAQHRQYRRGARAL